MAVLTSAQVRARQLPREEVPVPEWGGSVLVRKLQAAERDEFEQWVANCRKAGGVAPNVRARLVARALIDEEGQPLFGEADVALLGEKDADVLDRLFDVVQRISGMGLKAVEEAEKNSLPTPAGASSSS